MAHSPHYGHLPTWPTPIPWGFSGGRAGSQSIHVFPGPGLRPSLPASQSVFTGDRELQRELYSVLILSHHLFTFSYIWALLASFSFWCESATVGLCVNYFYFLWSNFFRPSFQSEVTRARFWLVL